MTAEKIIAADNKPQDKFADELLSNAELDNVAGGTVGKTQPPLGNTEKTTPSPFNPGANVGK